LKLTKAAVGKWRAQFIEQRIAGLYALAKSYIDLAHVSVGTGH